MKSCKTKNVNVEIEEALIHMMDEPDCMDKVFNDGERSLTKESSLQPGKKRECSWLRKRQYKHRQWRHFLNINPALEPKSLSGLSCYKAIFVGNSYYDEETDYFYHHNKHYNLNLFNHLFVSRRGDLRKLRGKLSIYRDVFVTGNPAWVKKIRRTTIRYVRHLPVSEGNCNSWNYYRKQFVENFS